VAGNLFPGWSHSSIGVAPDALEGETEVLAQLANGLTMLGVGIPVLRTNNDDPEGRVIAPVWRQHRCGEGCPLGTAQRQEQGHDTLHVSLEADVLLNKRAGGRAIGARCGFPRLVEVFLNHVTHHVGLERGFTFSLDPKPGFEAWGITDVLHS
jgi:hypothetical protein